MSTELSTLQTIIVEKGLVGKPPVFMVISVLPCHKPASCLQCRLKQDAHNREAAVRI